MMKHRTDFPDKDYKTRLQWMKEGKIPMEGVKGIELWTNPYHQQSSVYFLREEVREGSKEELEIVLQERKRTERIRAKKRYQEKKQYIDKLEKENNRLKDEKYELEWENNNLKEQILELREILKGVKAMEKE